MEYGTHIFIPNGALKEDRLCQEEIAKRNSIHQFMDEIELDKVYTFRMTREEIFDTWACTPGRHIEYHYEINAVPEIPNALIKGIVMPLPPNQNLFTRIWESAKYIVKG
jgi:hypothetical protein